MNILLAVCLCVSVAIFFITALHALNLSAKRHNQSAAYKAICLGTVGSAIYFFLPFYYDRLFTGSAVSPFLKSFFLSIHHAIRLFVVDANYDEIRDFAASFGLLGVVYDYFGILLLLTAPVLTFTFIVSFLQEVSAVFHVWFSAKRDHYIFSEINLQSLYLAQDIREKHPEVHIVFLGVDRENKSEYEKIKSYTRHIRPVLLATDLVQMNALIIRHKKNAKFFLIGENEEENAALVTTILDATPRASKREIYVRLGRNDRLLDNLPPYENTDIFRIEHVYSLVMHNLEKLGTRLFESAVPDGSGGKVISVLTVGLGSYGTEMVKNLAWFTQMEGYTTRIHAFEQDEDALERLAHLCPGFFGEDTADRHCRILVHPGMVYGTASFDRELAKIGNVGYVFIALGNDNLNVNAAFDIRKTFAGMGRYPIVQAVLRSGESGRLISSSKNYRGTAYNIEFIGSYEEIYCLDFITDAQNKEAAMQENLKWSDANNARKYLSHEEQYRSTKSLVVHKRLRKELNIPQEALKRCEHRRWVNFMFSEGYLYAPERNDIAKHRETLVPYDDLPEKFK